MELYKTLYENTKNITNVLSDTQKEYIITTIPKLDQNGHELLFFIIRIFHNQQSKDVSFKLPYNSSDKNEGGDIEFDLENFPTQLQHMIYMFVHMHFEYISYEQSRK
jgi:hypothetical protein